MSGNKVFLSRERADRMAQVRASIGRRLKEEYETARPLPERLSYLVKEIEKIERSTDERQSEPD